MSADAPQNHFADNGPDALQPESGKLSADRRGPGAARGLADFVESFLGGSRLRRGGLPTKAATAEQEEPPELLELLLEGPDAVIILHREQGEIIEANHRFAEWVGLERNTLAGRHFLNLFPEPERKAARTLFEDAGAGGVHVIEVPSAIKDVRPRLVEFTAAVSKAGHGAFAVVVGRDVGERAATERYLRAERDRLGLFIRAMRDMLILLSPAGDILYANAAAEQVFEPYELPVICHRWLNQFARFDNSDLQGLASAYEGRTLELDGSDGSVFLVTRSFLFESGQKAMVMLMAKDITDQRVVEKQNHQLEIELIRESKLAEFGTLSAGIAHNLNGPLTGILGFCDLIELTKPGQQEIAQIRSQAIAMRDIVANLLHKSRSERESQPQDLLIEDIIRTELRFLDANLFFKHDVKKIIELDPDSPTLYGVYIDFSQVIGNLLRNAIDAMFKSEQRVLAVRTQSTETHVIVTISDTGCGMSEDVRQKLFQPFFTTKPKSQDAKPGEPTGTGLGLSSSRSILARYGAEIGVTSAPGEGSTFTVIFPRHRKPAL
ncbi:MAG TPA: ATP-binding protein [bacterium]|jgi:two-component system NtrC family sensor kinase